jgi:tRNA(Glu) U13 pseudouridine synthase TruD
VKHVGSLLRRLFSLALEDIKQGEEFSAAFKLLPNAVEKHLLSAFDTMLWDRMTEAADKTHSAMEPMYTTINPNLPTFHASDAPHYNNSEEETYDERRRLCQSSK